MSADGPSPNSEAVYYKENTQTTYDQSQHLEVMYSNGPDNGKQINYYLKISGDYFGCTPGKDWTQACLNADHVIQVKPNGGPSYVPGSDPAAVDATVATVQGDYDMAKIYNVAA